MYTQDNKPQSLKGSSLVVVALVVSVVLALVGSSLSNADDVQASSDKRRY